MKKYIKSYSPNKDDSEIYKGLKLQVEDNIFEVKDKKSHDMFTKGQLAMLNEFLSYLLENNLIDHNNI